MRHVTFLILLHCMHACEKAEYIYSQCPVPIAICKSMGEGVQVHLCRMHEVGPGHCTFDGFELGGS